MEWLQVVDLVAETFKEENRFLFVCKCGNISNSKSQVLNHLINCNFVAILYPKLHYAFLTVCKRNLREVYEKYNNNPTIVDHSWRKMLKSSLGRFYKEPKAFECKRCKKTIPVGKNFVICHLIHCSSIPPCERKDFIQKFDLAFPGERIEYQNHFNPLGVKIFVKPTVKQQEMPKSKRMKFIHPSYKTLLFNLGSVYQARKQQVFQCNKCDIQVLFNFNDIVPHLKECQTDNKFAKLFISQAPVLISANDVSPYDKKAVDDSFVEPRLKKLPRANSCDEETISHFYQNLKPIPEVKRRSRKPTLLFNSGESDEFVSLDGKSKKPVTILPAVVYFNGVFDDFGFFSMENEFMCLNCKGILHSRLSRYFVLHLLYCLDDPELKSELILKFDRIYPGAIEDIVQRFDEKCLVRSLSDKSYLEMLKFVEKIKVNSKANDDENTPPV